MEGNKTTSRISASEYDTKDWNEWVEGNYLEPDLKYGTQYLETVEQVMLSLVQEVIKC
jgi:Glycosyltransferase WbsX